MATVVRFLKQGVGTQASVARLAFAELCAYGSKGPELSSGIECVAQALSDRSARKEAVSVLERCSANPACWASLVSFALPLLLDLFMEDTHLRTPTSDGGDQSGDARAHLARQMLTIVGRLSAQPEHGVAAMEMGYAFPIFHLLSGAEAHFLQGHGDMVHQALATLRLLLSHPPCVDSVVKMDQGHVLLHFLSLSAIPQGVLCQAMLCLDAITARSRQASAALAAERSTVDLLSDRVNTIGRATHNQEEEEEEEGKAEGDAVLVRLLYRLAAYAEGEDARHLWEHMVTRHYLHTLVLLLRERPQGVDASGLRRVQSGACDALSLLVQADHADSPSSPASSLAATLVSTGVLQDLARVLSEVPAAMQTLALLCDGQPAACTTLLASPPFLSRAVALMEAGRTNASPQELRDAACSIHVLALAVREDPVAASRLLEACTSARLLKPLLTSLTLSTQHLDPGTGPLRAESRDALELLVATLCPHATHDDAQGLSDDDLILFHSCPGVVLASRHLHGLSRTRALHCMARLSHSPKFARALIGRHVVPDLLGLFTAAEPQLQLQHEEEEEDDVEATRALALEILTHLSTSLPLITPEHLINARCLDSFLPLLSSPSSPPHTPQGFATARTRQKVLDLMTSMSASTTSVRRSLMSQGRLVPVLVALVSSAVTPTSAPSASRPATPVRPTMVKQEEEADAKAPSVDMPNERASALEAKGPPSPNSSSPLPSPVKSAPSSPIKPLPSPVRVLQPAVEVEVVIRLPIPDSSCELALRSALRILTNLAKMDENRIEIATCPGLFSTTLAVICACPDLQSDILLEACMLMQRLAMASVDAEEALGEALLTKTMKSLLGVLDRLQTHEHKDAAAPRVNESSAFLAFALTSLASTDAGQAVLQQVRQNTYVEEIPSITPCLSYVTSLPIIITRFSVSMPCPSNRL
jgi:hypothetical protein